jgi:hypothetical protein
VQFEEQLLMDLSATEREQFHRLLKLVLHNLDHSTL